jgi:hypothetical protein
VLSKVVVAIPFLGNGVGGWMTAARHCTTDHSLWFCSVTVFAKHDARGTAHFKSLKTRCLNQEFIFGILSTVQSIQIMSFFGYGNGLLTI